MNKWIFLGWVDTDGTPITIGPTRGLFEGGGSPAPKIDYDQVIKDFPYKQYKTKCSACEWFINILSEGDNIVSFNGGHNGIIVPVLLQLNNKGCVSKVVIDFESKLFNKLGFTDESPVGEKRQYPEIL